MEFNKERRNEIYKLALLSFERCDQGLYLCIELERIAFGNVNELNRDLYLYFPELKQWLPEGKIKHSAWFPLTKAGHKLRITILKEFIKETTQR